MRKPKQLASLQIVRSQDEIDQVLDACAEQTDAGTTRFRGERYESGIVSMWDWLTGRVDDNPMPNR